MTLTVIINVNQLSGEFKTLVNQALKLKPVALVVNSKNQEVIDYFISHYRKHHLTCFPIRSNLRYLIQEVSKTYRSQYYYCLNTVDPELTEDYLKLLQDDFVKSKAAYGHVIKRVEQSEIFCVEELECGGISHINQKLLFRNLQAEQEKSLHYMVSNLSLNYQPVQKLVNRTVLITGAMGGIGSEIARKFKRQGWSVVGIDLKPKSEIPAEEREHLSHYYDLDLSSSSRKVKRRIKQILKRIRRLDCLVHAAGLQINASINQTRSEDLSRTLNVNLKSVFLISQACFELLKKSVGSLVVINSVHAHASSQAIGAYAISKAALLGLVRNFAIEWGSYGIRVNGVAPGAIDTPMLTDGLTRRGEGNRELNLRLLQERHLMGRIGSPREIADLTYFLGYQNGFITGQTIVADGGASLILSTEVER